ncbi:unnamed protein product [Cyprideis torosa]|uniref:serine C-palmitoyltransferase n=1 Tax=Cyprideis torosa TaxID=163714 RepID=A0A7R8ZHG0_9CRUS|nr:unnamed protein product [Cyprideis torosa]CAG0883601.1 unnamed protein product [Cyprideis torosa]
MIPKARMGIWEKPMDCRESPVPEPSLTAAFFSYVTFSTLVIFGLSRDALLALGILRRRESLDPRRKEGYVQLYQCFQAFFTRNAYRLVRDCWNRPIVGVPGVHVTLKDRETYDNGLTFQFTGTTKKCINMGSYNYLGFAETQGLCHEASKESIQKYGVGMTSVRRELGDTRQLSELEEVVAEYLGTEAAMTFGMGFATNSLNIPGLVKKGDLVISDECNHSSLVLGMRLSGCTVYIFKHNDMKDLENVLRRSRIFGDARTRRPWKKILIVVEGIYSMEGSIVNLPEIMRLKQKYKAYLYLDEAHSIGAIGPNGKGVVDYFGLDVRDVDIMMGTFSKSFGASGGYIAGSKALINHLKTVSHGWCYATAMSPPVAQQIISAIRIILGKDLPGEGRRRIGQLLANARYLRQRLKQNGFSIIGDNDSPVVPLMFHAFHEISLFSRKMKELGIATVVVGFPATKLFEQRARFCCSASHTKEMLDQTIEAIIQTADFIGMKRNKTPEASSKPVPYILNNNDIHFSSYEA